MCPTERKFNRRQPMNQRSLHGQVIAITGGGRGIGHATASALVRAGAVVAIGDLDAQQASDAASVLGERCIGLALDVRDRQAFHGFLDQVESRLGPLDVLINNAGVMLLSMFADEDDDRSDLMIDVNLRGVLIGTRLALRRMLPRDRGHIVNVASSVAKVSLAGGATYSATKHAVFGLSDAVRAEIRSTGLEISCVMPGLVNTELGAGVPQPAVGGVGPEAVADAIVRVLRQPRFEVFVPRAIGAATKALCTLSTSGRDRLTAALHADDAFLKSDQSARAAYEGRYGVGL